MRHINIQGGLLHMGSEFLRAASGWLLARTPAADPRSTDPAP
jgi:hypothetical protein